MKIAVHFSGNKENADSRRTAEGVIRKKSNGTWGIVGHSGKMWNASYDTKTDAENALKAYHAQKNEEYSQAEIDEMVEAFRKVAKKHPLKDLDGWLEVKFMDYAPEQGGPAVVTQLGFRAPCTFIYYYLDSNKASGKYSAGASSFREDLSSKKAGESWEEYVKRVLDEFYAAREKVFDRERDYYNHKLSNLGPEPTLSLADYESFRGPLVFKQVRKDKLKRRLPG